MTEVDDIVEIGRSLEILFSKSWLGLVIIDDTLKILWKNAEAALLLPGAAKTAELDKLVLSVCWGRVERWLAGGGTMYVCAKNLEGDRVTINFIPCGKRTVCMLSPKFRTESLAVNAVVHDLKNPLSTIKSAASVLKQLVGDERSREICNIIYRNSARAICMCENLLTLCNESDCVNNLKRETISMRELAECISREVMATVLGIGLTIDFKASGAGMVYADKDAVERALLNLLCNAIEYCENKIEIELRCGESEVELSIKDNGKGLNEEAKRNLFKPYIGRGDTGHGLGLYVSKLIAMAHGGDVEYVDGIGGAEFVLRLPGAQGQLVRSAPEIRIAEERLRGILDLAIENREGF